MQVDFLVREWNLHCFRGRVILEEESEGGSGVEAGPQTSPQLMPTEESGATEAAMRPGLPKGLGTLACTDRGECFVCLFFPQKELWHFYIIR